jgi:hypothetical protein
LFEKTTCKIYSPDSLFFSADLGSDNRLTASRKIASDWEIFTMVKLDNNYVAFRAANGKYWAVNEKTLQLSATSDSIGKQEKFRIVNSNSGN